MTDDPRSESEHERMLGKTAGGGGAANAIQEHDNPIAGVFDDVEPRPGSSKPDPILIADHVSRHFGGLKAVDVEH
ncbi:MAG: hypothetical protein WBP59_13565, partial [Ilumatobacteraceae bacterium]